MTEVISAAEFDRTTDLPDWRVLLGRINAAYRAGSYDRAADLVGQIAAAAGAAGHHPDIDIRYPDRLLVTITTHAAGGRLTDKDVELADVISSLAAAAGAKSELTPVSTVEIGIDAIDIAAVEPFWAAVLGYQTVRGELHDPLRVGPSIWFQQMDEPRVQRNRIHLDVAVPHDIAESRVQAALDAGGTLLSDARAPAFWVLADPEGNEACITTWQNREG